MTTYFGLIYCLQIYACYSFLFKMEILLFPKYNFEGDIFCKRKTSFLLIIGTREKYFFYIYIVVWVLLYIVNFTFSAT